MLVLTRKSGEAIQIGDDITIEVLETRGGRVRLGITAPSSVGVRRSELLVTVSEMPSRPSIPAVPPIQRRPPVVASS